MSIVSVDVNFAVISVSSVGPVDHKVSDAHWRESSPAESPACSVIHD